VPLREPVLALEDVEVEVERVPEGEVDAPVGRDKAHEVHDRVPEAQEVVRVVHDEAKEHALPRGPALQRQEATPQELGAPHVDVVA